MPLPEVAERWVNLQFTWSGKPFELRIAESDRLGPELLYYAPYE